MRSSRAAVLGAALAVCLLAARARAEDGRPFSGTWTLAGTRIGLAAGGTRPATLVHATGSLVITKGDSLGKGFFGELAAFDDGEGSVVGRVVFSDEGGDKLFARLVADRLGTARHAVGTITGGTGRFSGASGSLSLSWKYIVAGDTADFESIGVAVEGRVLPKAAK